jgi:cytochrome c-type biogenesis protein CcmH
LETQTASDIKLLMVFWILAAVLTAIVTMALLLPLRRRGSVSTRGDHDAEVYSDQLAELDRDLKSGLISAAEATNARAEIARRLIRVSSGPAEPRHAAASSGLTRAAQLLIILGVPAAALGFYAATGQPDIPHQPLASRQAPTDLRGDIATLVSQAERHLAADPEDGRGWDVLAPIYMRTGRLDDARTAYRNAVRLLGPSAARQAGLGETLVGLAGGVVTEEARIAFESARELAPADPRARFFLALAQAQAGRDDRARAEFQSLLEEAPEGAPWVPAVQEQLAALGADPGTIAPFAQGAPIAVAPPTPPADAPIAMDDVQSGEQGAMIRDMVASLDSRLRESPDNVEGWVRLVRSYGVLGDSEAMESALQRGLEVFPETTAQGQTLVEAARIAAQQIAAREEAQ